MAVFCLDSVRFVDCVLLCRFSESRIGAERTDEENWYFIGVYVINRRERVRYFSTLEEKFRIFKRPNNIL